MQNQLAIKTDSPDYILWKEMSHKIIRAHSCWTGHRQGHHQSVCVIRPPALVADRTGESQLCHLLAVWYWAGFLTTHFFWGVGLPGKARELPASHTYFKDELLKSYGFYWKFWGMLFSYYLKKNTQLLRLFFPPSFSPLFFSKCWVKTKFHSSFSNIMQNTIASWKGIFNIVQFIYPKPILHTARVTSGNFIEGIKQSFS